MMRTPNEQLPIIASITKQEQIPDAIQSQVTRVNLMTGDIMTLDDIIYSLQKAGKQVYVHLEMVNGIGRDSSAVRFMAEHFQVDGIISTKSNTIAAAKNI